MRLSSRNFASGDRTAIAEQLGFSVGCHCRRVLTTACAIAAESSPERIISAVSGRSAICFDVANIDRADDIDVPESTAICSTADRNPYFGQVRASSTRRAINSFARRDHPLDRVELGPHPAGASPSTTASGSNPDTSSFKSCDAARTSTGRTLKTPGEQVLFMTRLYGRGETLTPRKRRQTKKNFQD